MSVKKYNWTEDGIPQISWSLETSISERHHLDLCEAADIYPLSAKIGHLKAEWKGHKARDIVVAGYREFAIFSKKENEGDDE